MPLYFADENIDDFCIEVAMALRAIKLHCAEIAVTPVIAIRMIEIFIQPLLPKEWHHLFYQQRIATWDGIREIFLTMDVYNKNYKSAAFLQAVNAIRIIYRDTKKTPRYYAIPVIDVDGFIGVCQKFELPIQNIFRTNNVNIDVFNFCALCWRHPMPGRKLCAQHSTVDLLKTNKTTAAARYKSGVRQRARFEEAVIDRLVSDIDFKQESITTDVLLPTDEMSAWLIKHRPLVWQLLGEKQQLFNDMNGVSMLIDLLHSPDGLPQGVRHAYIQINHHLLTHPLLICPMLLRAEAWLRSREELRAQWGGRRVGAGRRY